MQFHQICGSAVTLKDDRTQAVRRRDSYRHGVVFSDRPLPPHTHISLELTHTSGPNIGRVRFGLTTCEPISFLETGVPHFAVPYIAKTKASWIRALPRRHCANGNRITFHLDDGGRVHFSVNGTSRGQYLKQVTTSQPVWFIADLLGNTIGVRLLSDGVTTIPPEILIRGRDAVQIYQSACNNAGTMPLCRTRLMLVGQDGVGKTSLRRNLITEILSDDGEVSTDRFDQSAACSFNLHDSTAWRLASQTPRHSLNLSSIHDLKHFQAATRTTTTAVPAAPLAPTALHPLDANDDGDDDEEKVDDESDTLASNAVLEILHNLADRFHADNDINDSNQKDCLPTLLRNSAILNSDVYRRHVSELGVEVERLVRDKIVRLQSNELDANSDVSDVQLDVWDFSGKSSYHCTHQVFLTNRAIYVIVFDLRYGLNEPARPVILPNANQDQSDDDDVSELTNLEWIHFWLKSIHAHASRNSTSSLENQDLSPPVFIVGTHRLGLDDDDAVRDKHIAGMFGQLADSLIDRPYRNHVISQFYAVENLTELGKDDQISALRSHIQRLAGCELYMGEHLPVRWLQFERALSKLVADGTYYISVDQLREVAKEELITSPDELQILLEFYHDLGMLLYFGGLLMIDDTLRSTVILKPQWLVEMFARVITCHTNKLRLNSPITRALDAGGVIDDHVISHIFSDVVSQKSALIGLMEKFDLITPRLPPISVIDYDGVASSSYYVPSRVSKRNQGNVFTPSNTDVIFYVDFIGFLPDDLFHRILTRAIRWSQDNGGRDVKLRHRRGRFYFDQEHDFILEMSALRSARIKITVIRVAHFSDQEFVSVESNLPKPVPTPSPDACAKVRNFVESTLCALRMLWVHRLSYRTCVACLCDRRCQLHQASRCPQDTCLHLLNLDECLTHKIVCCEHRRIQTQVYRSWFPVSPRQTASTGPILPESAWPLGGHDGVISSIEQQQKGVTLPAWVKSAAKLLNGGCDGQDWMALAKRLGYKKTKINRINDDLNPGLTLIVDWIVSSGNTPLSVDLMVSCLGQMRRDDIVDIIEKGREMEGTPSQVFISYQWDIQDDVKLMRDRLERAGYSCWMDVGQMGGGDQLNAKIDQGIRNCKVVVACVTPKYVVSHLCNRELSLSDVLRKPIIPVMFAKVPWPPPGGLALVFSQLVYVDMKGVGGHGGSGIHADTEARYQEIVRLAQRHCTPKTRNSAQQIERRLHGEEKRGSHDANSARSDSRASSDTTIAAFPLQQQQQQPNNLQQSSADTIHGPLARVGEVHVSKCAVCAIL